MFVRASICSSSSSFLLDAFVHSSDEARLRVRAGMLLHQNKDASNAVEANKGAPLGARNVLRVGIEPAAVEPPACLLRVASLGHASSPFMRIAAFAIARISSTENRRASFSASKDAGERLGSSSLGGTCAPR